MGMDVLFIFSKNNDITEDVFSKTVIYSESNDTYSIAVEKMGERFVRRSRLSCWTLGLMQYQEKEE